MEKRYKGPIILLFYKNKIGICNYCKRKAGVSCPSYSGPKHLSLESLTINWRLEGRCRPHHLFCFSKLILLSIPDTRKAKDDIYDRYQYHERYM